MRHAGSVRSIAWLLAVAAVGFAAVLLLDGTDAPATPADAATLTSPPEQGAGAQSPEPPAATPLWSSVDEADVDDPPPYAPQWATEGRVLVRVAPAAEAAGGWRVGDRVRLPLPQLGVVYESVIDELDVGPGPSVSALGKVVGNDGRRRRFVVTVGPAHVFAYIDTPSGPHELTGDTEFGWLLPSSSMMAGFDFSEPDYIPPERWGEPETP